MRKAVIMTATLALCLGLSGCGRADNADESASSDTVEMPAEQALSGIAATPAVDPAATATPGADSGTQPQAAPATKAASGEPDKD